MTPPHPTLHRLQSRVRLIETYARESKLTSTQEAIAAENDGE